MRIKIFLGLILLALAVLANATNNTSGKKGNGKNNVEQHSKSKLSVLKENKNNSTNGSKTHDSELDAVVVTKSNTVITYKPIFEEKKIKFSKNR